VLEDDDHDQDDGREQRREQAEQRRQLEQLGAEVDERHDPEADGHLDGAGATQDEQRAIDDPRDDDDVDEVSQDLRERAGDEEPAQELEHDLPSPLPPPIPSANAFERGRAARTAAATESAWRVSATSCVRTTAAPRSTHAIVAARLPP